MSLLWVSSIAEVITKWAETVDSLFVCLGVSHPVFAKHFLEYVNTALCCSLSLTNISSHFLGATLRVKEMHAYYSLCHLSIVFKWTKSTHCFEILCIIIAAEVKRLNPRRVYICLSNKSCREILKILRQPCNSISKSNLDVQELNRQFSIGSWTTSSVCICCLKRAHSSFPRFSSKNLAEN